jgi:hypothetical protein
MRSGARKEPNHLLRRNRREDLLGATRKEERKRQLRRRKLGHLHRQHLLHCTPSNERVRTERLQTSKRGGSRANSRKEALTFVSPETALNCTTCALLNGASVSSLRRGREGVAGPASAATATAAEVSPGVVVAASYEGGGAASTAVLDAEA